MRIVHVEVYVTRRKSLEEIVKRRFNPRHRRLVFEGTLNVDGSDFFRRRLDFDDARYGKSFSHDVEIVVNGSLVDDLSFCEHCGSILVKMPWDRPRVYCDATCRNSEQAKRMSERQVGRRRKR